MPKIFDKIGLNKPRYSAFDLSREQKLSMKMGQLIPTYLDEIVPGDQFRVRSECMMRLAPMLAPVMHRVNVYMHYFFVPNRIVWNQWEDFITGGKEGTSEPTFPTLTMGSTMQNNGLADYLGVPDLNGNPNYAEKISALPFRAYQKIFTEYYRDENLHDEIDVESMTLSEATTIRKRAWEKDYFTSSLPWPQRGEGVGVPGEVGYKDISEVKTETGVDKGSLFMDSSGNLEATAPGASSAFSRLENLEGIDIDINDLRRSSALQRWLEKSARGGYRYIETILAHFGVKSDDARLQRPEYLGGGRQPIVISEVLNTSATATEPQGDMAGHGISSGTTNSFQKRFNEHGYVMGILSVLPRTAYQQGIHRHWLRDDRFDFYWPEFADLGEQEVLNKELYVDNEDEAYSNGTFGYQQRYAEMKYGCSTVHGDFRDTLEYWHMGRIFAAQPNLNKDFVEYPDFVNAPSKRIFANQDGTDTLWVQLYHNVKARRPMPYFSNPKLT